MTRQKGNKGAIGLSALHVLTLWLLGTLWAGEGLREPWRGHRQTVSRLQA